MAKDRVAVVLGDADLVRPLAKAHIPVAVMTPSGSLLASSRYARTLLEPVDAREDPGGFVGALLDFARGHDAPPVLFYEYDDYLLAISRHRDELAAAYGFVLPPASTVEDLVDKTRFVALAQRLDLPIPETRIVAVTAPDPPDLDLRFPVIIKPPVRDPDWDRVGGAAKAIRLERPDDLRAQWSALRSAGASLIAQELIEGSERRIESYHAYVARDGHTAGEFTGAKIRTRPAMYGHSTALETTDSPGVLALGREVLARLAITGVVKLDFKRDPAGQLRLLEVNPRFNLWHHPGAIAGVNMPLLAWHDVLGEQLPPPTIGRAGVRWVKVSDYRAARDAGVSTARWIRFALRAQARSGVSLDDPVPIVRFGVRAINGRAARVLSRSRSPRFATPSDGDHAPGQLGG